ncbi:integrase/recombinase XerD [Flavobacterium sp. 28YEA47A]|uniref:tyrosine-type recombinase/integrase n=1 Tax=Flavobacterium sp. 28YEA47A TaxID=3156276 RepID=UPI00351722A0
MKKTIQTPSYQNLFRDYENLILARNYKAKIYPTATREFLIWMEEFGITLIREVTTKEMMGYYEYLITRPNQRRGGVLSSSSVRLHLLSISIFQDGLLENRNIEKTFLIPKHGENDQKPRSFLTVEETRILYGACENPLEKALLSIAYGCGLRRAEIQDLSLSDVDRHKGMLIVRKGKNGKRREVPMSDSVLEDVKKYLSDFRYQNLGSGHIEEAFFINKKGRRMSGDMLNNTLKKIVNRSQNQTIIGKEITLHCLRHSIAHHLSENNAGIDFIRDFLGHSFINTAHIYAIKNKTKREILLI